MGVGSSSGTAYSMDGAISSNIPMSTSGPYVTNQVQGEVWNQVVPQSSEYLQHIGMPYMRCAMVWDIFFFERFLSCGGVGGDDTRLCTMIRDLAR